MDRSLYISALVAYVILLLARVPSRARPILGHPAWIVVGVLLHSGALALAWFYGGRLPLDSMRDGLSALSLWVVIGWAYLRRRPKMEDLGTVLLGLAVLLLAAGQLAPGPGGESEADFSTIWFPLHVLLMLLGFTGFALAFSMSALFLFVRRRLKQKRLKDIARLPSLDTLDRLNLQAMALGFVALTAGMAVGGLWGANHPEGDLAPDITIYATVAVWIWYAAGLHVRLVAGWRGRLAALFGVFGFAGLVILFSIAVLVLRGWHGFGD